MTAGERLNETKKGASLTCRDVIMHSPEKTLFIIRERQPGDTTWSTDLYHILADNARDAMSQFRPEVHKTFDKHIGAGRGSCAGTYYRQDDGTELVAVHAS